jgi:hypothetical protein
MGSALASPGSAADFNSSQSSPLPRPRLRLGATVAAAAALLACDDRTPLTLVGADRTTVPNPATQDLPRSVAHPFYTRLNQILEQHDFDGYVEALCVEEPRSHRARLTVGQLWC